MDISSKFTFKICTYPDKKWKYTAKKWINRICPIFWRICTHFAFEWNNCLGSKNKTDCCTNFPRGPLPCIFSPKIKCCNQINYFEIGAKIRMAKRKSIKIIVKLNILVSKISNILCYFTRNQSAIVGLHVDRESAMFFRTRGFQGIDGQNLLVKPSYYILLS
jgi:hypothetical protein